MEEEGGEGIIINNSYFFYRYSEMYELYELITKSYPKVKVAKLSRYSLFTHKKTKIIESRKQIIENFLTTVLKHQDVVRNPEKVLRFLGLPLNLFGSGRREEEEMRRKEEDGRREEEKEKTRKEKDIMKEEGRRKEEERRRREEERRRREEEEILKEVGGGKKEGTRREEERNEERKRREEKIREEGRIMEEEGRRKEEEEKRITREEGRRTVIRVSTDKENRFGIIRSPEKRGRPNRKSEQEKALTSSISKLLLSSQPSLRSSSSLYRPSTLLPSIPPSLPSPSFSLSPSSYSISPPSSSLLLPLSSFPISSSSLFPSSSSLPPPSFSLPPPPSSSLFTAPIRIFLPDKSSLNISSDERTTAKDLCREIQKIVGLTYIEDFRLSIREGDEDRILDEDELILKRLFPNR